MFLQRELTMFCKFLTLAPTGTKRLRMPEPPLAAALLSWGITEQDEEHQFSALPELTNLLDRVSEEPAGATVY